jgi:hypothetical protein
MAHIAIRSTEISLSPSKIDFLKLLLKFFADGIRDLNRYLDAASLVHPAGPQNRSTTREPSWEGWL